MYLFYFFLINLFQFGTDEAVRTLLWALALGRWAIGYWDLKEGKGWLQGWLGCWDFRLLEDLVEALLVGELEIRGKTGWPPKNPNESGETG